MLAVRCITMMKHLRWNYIESTRAQIGRERSSLFQRFFRKKRAFFVGSLGPVLAVHRGHLRWSEKLWRLYEVVKEELSMCATTRDNLLA